MNPEVAKLALLPNLVEGHCNPVYTRLLFGARDGDYDRDPEPRWPGSGKLRKPEPRYYDDDPYRPDGWLAESQDCHWDGVSRYPYWRLAADHRALVTASDNGNFTTDDEGRWHRKGWEPAKTFDKSNRRYRTNGYSSNDVDADNPDDWYCDSENPDDTEQDTRPVQGSLAALHEDTNGGWGIDLWSRVSSKKLEVCRECGRDLGLPRDEQGHVIRKFETQRQYCSDRCEADADNGRDRQARRGVKWPRVEHGWYLNSPEIGFDLDSITVAGVGRLDIPPHGWNRHNPRRDRHLVQPRPGDYRNVFALSLHEYVMMRRNDYRFAGTRRGEKSRPVFDGQLSAGVSKWRDSKRSTFMLRRTKIHPFVWKVTHRNGALAS